MLNCRNVPSLMLLIGTSSVLNSFSIKIYKLVFDILLLINIFSSFPACMSRYYTTGNLNKKSDLYSFGIVLLELITSRPAIITDIEDEPIHICQWARPKFERMEIESIVDSRIQGTYNNSSAWKAIKVAMACVASTSIQRPDIIIVYNEVKECLKIEVPPEIKKMPEIIEESDDSICYSGDSVYIMSHIKSETESYSNELFCNASYKRYETPCVNLYHTGLRKLFDSIFVLVCRYYCDY